MRTSYAQNAEDILLWRALGNVERGFYIDIGAAHPVTDSVTALFYENGWSGINVEPAAGVFATLQSARPRDINLNLLAGADEGVADFYVVGDENGLSTTVPELAHRHELAGYAIERRQLPTTTLATICASLAPEEIHFLKIDAEGAERAILQSADFTRHRPWIVLVEATLPNTQTPSHEEWEPLLLDTGYNFVHFDGLNRFYLASERSSLRPHLLTAPNLHDQFETAAQRDLRDQLGRARTEVATIQAGPDAREARLAGRLVTALYHTFLDRDPEPGVVPAYVADLVRTGDVQDAIDAILGSAEFAAKRAGFDRRYPSPSGPPNARALFEALATAPPRRPFGFGRRPALLNIDLQNAYTRPDEFRTAYAMHPDQLPLVDRLAAAFRARELPVVWTYVAYSQSGDDCGVWGQRSDGPDALQNIREGERRAQLDDRLTVDSSRDTVINKRMASAFHETILSSLLRFHGVDTLVLTGGSTSGCVRATAVDSLSHGFRTIVPIETTADRHESPHFASLYDLAVKYADVLPVEAVFAHLDTMPP